MAGLEALLFNAQDGYLEAVVRGHKAGLLRQNDYHNLFQCETLEDLKLNLSSTDYGPYLANVSGALTPALLVERATAKLVDDWDAMRSAASAKLAKFLDFCVIGHMIDNVVLVVSGSLRDRDVQELLDKCHPLGRFEGLAALAVASSMRELYRLVLVDTPLAPYFAEELTADDLDEMNVEVMRNTLYKAYLDDFAAFCSSLGGATAELMGDLLAFDADRRALNITLNSIGTELTRDDRRRLYSSVGLLHPHGHAELAGADDFDAVRAAAERCPPYREVFARLAGAAAAASAGSAGVGPGGAAAGGGGGGGGSSGGGGEPAALDRVLFEEEARRCSLTFERQFHYAVFFAYLRLREQEARNLMWVSECIAQDVKHRAPDGVVAPFAL